MPENNSPPYTLTTSTDLEVMRRRRSDISDESRLLGLFVAYVAYVGVESEERMIELSRGSGRLQRRILELLEQSPERKMSRKHLDEVLVELEGFDPSNVLRAVRSLARQRLVIFEDGHTKENSFVRLPPKIEPIPESWVFEMLAEIGGT